MTRLPYPGLRAYTRDETDLFFGREGCVNEMIDRLSATRFLAVLGASGSGKSSLVRTGLFDGLELGLYAEAGADWAIADMHPGGKPIHNLAAALLEARGGPFDPIDLAALEAHLKRGPLALAEWLTEENLRPGRNLLVLVDQFEELFRYSNYAGREQAEGFVALLLESKRVDPRIHVAITMRSEYLGACALIPGLAQAINAGLYLTRRMTREECREAIVGPAAVMGFEVEPALVTRILNDLASFAPWSADQEESQVQRLSRQADQLPLMQHALSRLWQVAEQHKTDGRTRITLQDYENVGELRGALEQHADEVIRELDEEARPLVRPIFRALVTGPSLADGVRRPRRFGDLVAITGASETSVRRVVDAFRAPGRNFLRPSLPDEISDDSIIDISHESLIRQWKSLSNWFQEEANASALWQRQIGNAARHARGEGDLLNGLDLANALAWWDRERPSKAWAEGHGGHFDEVSAYLETSRAAEQAETDRAAALALQERRRLRVRAATWAALALVCALTAAYAIVEARRADQQTQVALEQTSNAEAARAEAEAERNNAQLAAAEAEEQRRLAEQAAHEADAERLKAEEAAREAEEQRRLAQEAAAEADVERKNAEAAARDADEQRRLAEEAAAEAERQRERAEQAAADAVEQRQAAERARREAEQANTMLQRQEARGLVRMARAEILQGRPTEAMKLALAAWPRRTNSRGVQSLETAEVLAAAMTAHADSIAEVQGAGAARFALFSPDGRHAVVASAGSEAVLFDVRTGATAARLDDHSGEVSWAEYSPDGTLVATASADGTAGVYDAATGALVTLIQDGVSGFGVLGVSFSPDSSRIVLWVQGISTAIYDARTGELVSSLEGHTDWIRTAVFSPDGSKVLTASDDRTARLWDAETGSQLQVFQGHSDWLRTAQFSSDGTMIVTGADDSTARVYDTASGRELAVLAGHTGRIATAFFSPDGGRVLTGSFDNTARIYDLKELKPSTRGASASFGGGEALAMSGGGLRSLSLQEAQLQPGAPTITGVELAGHTDWVRSAYFSPDGTMVVTASDDQTARVWDGSTGAELLVLTGHTNWLTSAVFSPDGSTVLTASLDGSARLWDAESGELLRILLAAAVHDADQPSRIATLIGHEGAAYSARFSPDGTRAVSASNDQTVRIWDAATGDELHRLELEGNVTSASYSADGRYLLTSTYVNHSSVGLWDATQEPPVLIRTFRTGQTMWSAFSPDGARAVVAGWDSNVTLWDVETGDKIGEFFGHERSVWTAEFSRDGTRVVTAAQDGTARIWDAETREELFRLQIGEPGEEFIVYSAQMSPDGTRVVTTDANGSILIWDATTGERLHTFTGAGISGYYASFSPDGTWIAASGSPVVSLVDGRFGMNVTLAPIDEGDGDANGYTAEFSPEGDRIILALSSGTVAIIDISTLPKGDLFQLACRRLGTDTSLDDARQRYLFDSLPPICGDSAPAPLDFARLMQ